MKFIIASLFLILPGSIFAECLPKTYLSCDDATTLAKDVTGAVDKIFDHIAHQRELAAESSMGDLGDNERGFLSQEYRAVREEIKRIIFQTSFRDEFQRRWKPLKNGMSFWTPVPVEGSEFAYRRPFEFKPLEERLAHLTDEYLDSDIAYQSGAEEALVTLDEVLAVLNHLRLEFETPVELCP